MKQLFFILILLSYSVFADEGMWLLNLIHKKYEDLKKQGFRLSSEDIYNINKACIKDAIVGLSEAKNPLSFFCSGSIVSDKGLVFTNYHCVEDYIQKHSTIEKNYFENGFWAKNYNEELPNNDLCASILIKIIDVTNQILTTDIDTISNISEKRSYIQTRINEIMSVYEDEPYSSSIVEMFGGNQYLMFLYETYYDVRLVGVPPSNIGSFGGETDNWMWPRHTGDFAILRIYTSPEGKPAYYSENNIPLKPKKFLKINTKGIKKADFTMIIGFPGSTNRYYTSYNVNFELNNVIPYIVKIRQKKLDVLANRMKTSKKINLQYQAKYREISNYYKYYLGQNEQLRKNNVVDKKLKQEQIFIDWLSKDSIRQKNYKWVLPYIKNYYENNQLKKLYTYIDEAILQSSDIILFNLSLFNYIKSLEDIEDQNKIKKELKETIQEFYKNFDAETDKQVFIEMTKLYMNEFSEDYYFSYMFKIKDKYKGNIEKYANDLYKNSIYLNENLVYNYIENFNDKNAKKLFNNDFVDILKEIYYFYIFYQDKPDSLYEAERLWIKAQMEMFPDSIFYPDANSTIRLTYGYVADYYPKDAVHYDYYTTIDGVIEKDNPENQEFIVPEKLKKLYYAKDFGKYAQENTLPVCFITTNDITGGNSGSGVMDADGNLIGIAFDGNWEAMSSDISYEKDKQRCICVDIRYVLYIIEKFAEATNIINELKFI